jgi:hypothetical protein
MLRLHLPMLVEPSQAPGRQAGEQERDSEPKEQSQQDSEKRVQV